FALRDTGPACSWEIRRAAIRSLALVCKDEEKGPPDPLATRALLEVLRSETTINKVRLEAVQALGSIGKPKDERAHKTMLTALKKEKNSRDQVIAVWAYVGLMVQDAMTVEYLDALLALLKSSDVATQAQAARALGEVANEVNIKLKDEGLRKV